MATSARTCTLALWPVLSLVLSLVLELALAAAGSGGGGAGGRACALQADCTACLRSPGCRWCAARDLKGSKCAHESMAVGSWCDGFEWGPENKYHILDNGDDNTQIKPRHAILQLRAGETKRINITYRRMEDYPIDLYYLLDSSRTMKNYKTQISKMGRELAYAMKKVTNNFRLGFGSFVDKVKLPFVFTAPHLMRKPCQSETCATPYSFKNHLPLGDDPDVFSKELDKTPISTNNDSPEGGLDALMQAIVCKDEINWRPKARHLLVLSTDDIYHMAGDGKLAGAVEPNPELCMLNDKNEYIGYASYDYPTISQINRKAKDNKINIIFAVKNSVSNVYMELSRKIDGSKTEILSENATNIIRIITDVYNEFEKSVKLIDDAGSSGIGIVYYSNCSNTGELIATNECYNVNGTSPVTFEVAIAAKSCPPDLKEDIWRTTINISPHGVNEMFQLDIEVFCFCPCEFAGHKYYEQNSSYCNFHGKQKCGICECDEKSTGKNCNCERDKVPDDNEFAACISDEETQTVCSGRGTCKCGICVCDQKQNHLFDGKYCQCDNLSCKRLNDLMCSGRGVCSCGECKCNAGWSGEACECAEMQTSCIAYGENEICSGHGSCECGKCKCDDGRKGKYCGDCMQSHNVTCPGGRCKEFTDCVECLVHKTGKHAGSSCSNCSISLLNIIIEKEIIENQLAEEDKFCQVPDSSGCFFIFTYKEEPEFLIRAVKEKECTSVANLLGIVFGITGTILFLTLFGIILWKIITSIHDRREYEKYMKSLEQTKWSATNNPLHQEPTTTTMNPTYNSRRSRFSFMLRR